MRYNTDFRQYQPAGMPLRFAVLGPFEVRSGAECLALGSYKQRVLLAALLCRANTVIPLDQLLDLLWAGGQPRTARKNLQVYISGLRKIVGGRISHHAHGYMIKVGMDELDLLKFESLSAAGRTARRCGDPGGARSLLGEAVLLWRDRALVDLADNAFIATESDRLVNRFLDVYEDWADLEIWAGHHLDVLARLSELSAEYPFRERLIGATMTALEQSGSRREALACYESHRQFMARELGLDPSPVLQDLYCSILHADSAAGLLPAQLRVDNTLARRSSRPAQLPRDLPDFVGRGDQVGELITALCGDGPQSDVAIITGVPGAGKTALAIRVGHLLADQFADGQVFVSLRAQDGKELTWREILTELMQATGHRVTPSAEEAVALASWRSWVAERHCLLVLDDATSETCVRRLLPGSGPSRTLITSSRLLSGLESVRRVEVGDFSHAEATELLECILGTLRTCGAENQIRRIMLRCGGLPLVIRTIAVKLTMLRHLSLAEYADQLERTVDVLDELAMGDMALRTRLLRFHDGLSSLQQRAFYALGALPGPQFSQEDMTVVLGGLPAPAERVLEELMEACLITVPDGEVIAHSIQYEIPVPAYRLAVSLYHGGSAGRPADYEEA